MKIRSYTQIKRSRKVYHYRLVARSIIVSMIGMFFSVLPIIAYMDIQNAKRINSLISPLPAGVTSNTVGSGYTDTGFRAVSLTPAVVATPTPVLTELQKYDLWVGQYVDHYFDKPSQQSEARMVMQCLLHRETKHYTFKGEGDGGLAKGILQWHDATWNRARKEMIKQGEADQIGWSLDPETAIKTTVWALKESSKPRNKRVISITEWGPVLRSYNGSDFATCPVPTWYQK